MDIAIIGFGKMGKIYDSLLNGKYIVDVNPVMNRIYFSNVDEFIDYRQPVDLVIVSTPIQNHYEIVKKLLMNDYNVLCEKPLCFSSNEAKLLEKLAQKRKLILYQSTLERYNPIVQFLKRNIKTHEIKKIKSYRFGLKPQRDYSINPKFDLGIHDIDLWFYLFERKIPWQVNVEYGKPRREIFVYLKNGNLIKLDLLNKMLTFNKTSIMDFSKTHQNNPILDMVFDLLFNRRAMNEKWSDEIKVLEETSDSIINLKPI